MAINRVLISGNLVRDPEVRYTAATQMCCARLTVALDRGKTAEGKDRGADYPQAVFWGKLAENIEKYCRKGALVTIEGKLRTGSYTNHSGQKIYFMEIAGDRIQYFRQREVDKAKDADYPEAPLAVDTTGSDDWSSQQSMDFIQDDDIPF